MTFRSSPEGTRSESGALLYRHSERGITENTICERSELRIKNCNLRAERVKVLFSKIHPQEKVVLRVLILVLISFRKLSALVFCGVEGCFWI